MSDGKKKCKFISMNMLNGKLCLSTILTSIIWKLYSFKNMSYANGQVSFKR